MDEKIYKIYIVQKTVEIVCGFKVEKYDKQEINYVPETTIFYTFDDAVKYIKHWGTVYYTLVDMDGEETFLFYTPEIGNWKYMIQAEDFFCN